MFAVELCLDPPRCARCRVLSLTVGLRAGPGERDQSFHPPPRLRTLLPPHQTASGAAVTQHTRSGTRNTGQLASSWSGKGAQPAKIRRSVALARVASHCLPPNDGFSVTVMVPFANALLLFLTIIIIISHTLLLSYEVNDLLLTSPQTQTGRAPDEMFSHPQSCSTWTAEYMRGRGREAFCLGASRRIPNPSLLRAVTSWRSRTCRKTGTTLVMDGEFKTLIPRLSNSAR